MKIKVEVKGNRVQEWPEEAFQPSRLTSLMNGT